MPGRVDALAHAPSVLAAKHTKDDQVIRQSLRVSSNEIGKRAGHVNVLTQIAIRTVKSDLLLYLRKTIGKGINQ